MESTDDSGWPIKSENPPDSLGHRLEWCGNFFAVLFNTGFAILAIVTLCGIVFITRPKVVMHDISPVMWLPLLVVMAPCQIYAQFLSWATVLSGQNPTGPAIASRQKRVREVLRPLVAFFWFCNFCVEFGIVVSLSKPHPGDPPLASAIVGLTLDSWFAFAANVYLLLAIRTCTRNKELLDRVWRARFPIALSMAIAGTVYSRL